MTPSAPSGEIDDRELVRRVTLGAAALELPITTDQAAKLVQHVRLIARWNATYNLTAVRDPSQMVTQHVLDCLAAAAALLRHRRDAERTQLLDVGSGAGLPGLVIAIIAPQCTVTCLDSVGKKAAFLTQAIGELGLRNASAHPRRVQSFEGATFDVITSRAFASLQDFVVSTRHLMSAAGSWMAMKGKVPTAELSGLAPGSFHVEPLVVPGLDAERCVVWIRGATGDQSECVPPPKASNSASAAQ